MLFSDITSQIVLLVYVLYSFLTKTVYNFIGWLTNKSLSAFNIETSKKLLQSSAYKSEEANTSTRSLPSLFNLHVLNACSSQSNVSLYSKLLNSTSQSLNTLSSTYSLTLDKGKCVDSVSYSRNLLFGTLKPNSISRTALVGNITELESKYVNSAKLSSYNLKNLNLNLNNFYNVTGLLKSPTGFDFNIHSNLLTAQQQRWLAKNSLLSESIVPNSFLVTQAKKLIGYNTLNKDFSQKTLWLPTKASKLSSIESAVYFNNITGSVFKDLKSLNILNTKSLISPNFDNLNFFENSRIWLFKKYFFTNNQTLSLFTSTPLLRNNVIPSRNEDYKQFSSLIFNSNKELVTLLDICNTHISPSTRLISSKPLPNFFTNSQASANAVSITTPNLDILSGSDNNFFFTITTNPNQLNNNASYFNNLNSTSVPVLSGVSSSEIKFFFK